MERLTKVQKEGRRIQDLHAAYPGVTFKHQIEWLLANTDLADGMDQLISTLKEKKDEIKRQRIGDHFLTGFIAMPASVR